MNAGEQSTLRGRGITIRQPWASLIAMGVKSIETRSWSTKYRGPLVIHAGKRLGREMDSVAGMVGDFSVYRDQQMMIDRRERTQLPWHLPLGAAVATCELVDVVPMVGPLTIGEHDKHEIVFQIGPGRLLASVERWIGGGQVHTHYDDQLPYGDFAPGRFAWILSNVQAIYPVPMNGRQGLWKVAA